MRPPPDVLAAQRRERARIRSERGVLPMFSGSPAACFRGERQMEQGKHGLTDDDLRNWRPAAAARGRRAAK